MIGRALLLACTLVVLLTGCGGSSGSHTVDVPQLHSIGQLRSVFNAHQGVPRLVVLVSPT